MVAGTFPKKIPLPHLYVSVIGGNTDRSGSQKTSDTEMESIFEVQPHLKWIRMRESCSWNGAWN